MGSRGKWKLAATLAAGLIALTACGSPGGSDDEGGGDGPIKVGLLSPSSGSGAAAGTDMRNGMELFFSQRGKKMGGREVDTIHEDTASDPTTALTKARKLVQQDAVKLFIGPMLSSEAYAVANYLKQQQDVIGLNPTAGADDLSQRMRVDNYIRAAGWPASPQTHVAGDWAYDQGWRRVVTLCHDYAFGHENCGGFVNTFSDRGGKVVKQLWAPLGTSDYSSFVAQIPKSVDGVFVAICCSDSARFISSWTNLGMKGKVPVVTSEATLDQQALRGLTNDDAVGLMSFGHYAEGRQEAGTRDFVAAYRKAHKQVPSAYSCGAYAASQWLATAADAAKEDIGDSAKFAQAINGVRLQDSCLGPARLDEQGGLVSNVYLRKVAREGGDLVNQVVETFGDIGQFWRYKPETFLDQPVYSRRYQGEKWPPDCSAFASECPLK